MSEIIQNKITADIPDFVEQGKILLPELVDLRREIHQDPELGLDLPRTQRRVLKALEGLPLEITLGKNTTSVVAVLRGDIPGPTVLLRGDMDGLPIEEATGLDYASTTGTMHAYGHDMHTVGLIGAAKILSNHISELPGKVVFMFQPGEEGFGGAQVMIDEGLLEITGEPPIGAYAIHVAPGPRGVFATRVGSACAGSNQLFVTVQGRGGHGSQPHLAIDPVPAASEIVLGIQSFITRKFDAFDPVVCSVTRFNTGEGAVNVIPEKVELAATIRTLSAQSLEKIRTGIANVVESIAGAHECSVDIKFEVLYPSTINDADTTDLALNNLRQSFGNQRVVVAPSPMMGSEDFAFVLEEVPGTFLAMFATPSDFDQSKVEFNHSPRVVFDDSLLGDQAAALASLAYGRLLSAATER